MTHKQCIWNVLQRAVKSGFSVRYKAFSCSHCLPTFSSIKHDPLSHSLPEDVSDNLEFTIFASHVHYFYFTKISATCAYTPDKQQHRNFLELHSDKEGQGELGCFQLWRTRLHRWCSQSKAICVTSPYRMSWQWGTDLQFLNPK